MPKTYAHSQRARLVSKHLASGAIFINDHVAWMQRLRQTLALVLDEDCGNASVEIGLRTFEPLGFDLIKRRQQLVYVCDAAGVRGLQFEKAVKQMAYQIVVEKPLVHAKTCKAVSKRIYG